MRRFTYLQQQGKIHAFQGALRRKEGKAHGHIRQTFLLRRMLVTASAHATEH